MLDYKGVKCPVCQVPFLEDDDIVVCPECGAPYHRECYQKEGHCLFEDTLHKENKDWTVPPPPEPPDPAYEIKDSECAICGTLNAHSALFCNRCGASLAGEPARHRNTAGSHAHKQNDESEHEDHHKPPFYNGAGFGGMPFIFDPMGGVSPSEILGNNVTCGDVSKVVQQNTQYYLPVFKTINTFKKNKFNFCAFLFSGPWMLYRKQYKLGGIITGLIFLLYVAYIAITLYVSAPVLTDIAEQVGIDITQGFAPTESQMIAMTDILMKDPGLYFQIALPLLCIVGILVINLIVGIMANKLYMKHCVETVQKAKTKSAMTGESSDAIIHSKGGVNVAVAVCIFVCYLLLSNITLFI